MAPNYYEQYDVGAYTPGVYDELFNSDKDVYGGWNQYNGAPSYTSPGGPENRPYHVTIKLGSYCALILKLRVERHEEPKAEPVPEKEESKAEPASEQKQESKPAKKPAAKKAATKKPAAKKAPAKKTATKKPSKKPAKKKAE